MLNSVLVAIATSTVRGIPTEVMLGADEGMPRDCALSFDNITPVPKALLTEPITRLGPAKLAEIRQALNIAVGC